VLSPEPFFLDGICTKSFSGWGFAPDPTGELTTLLSPLPRKGRGKGMRGGKGKRGREGRLPPFGQW